MEVRSGGIGTAKREHMQRELVRELHYICPLATVPSVRKLGILSKYLQKKLCPDAPSLADPEIQRIREAKVIPGGKRLHSYANLYFDSHNAMLSRLRNHNDDIAILRVDSDVLDLPDVIVTDRNAAACDVIFRPMKEGLANLDPQDVYRVWWATTIRTKQKRQAEVLVPERVPPKYVLGAYVFSKRRRTILTDLCPELTVVVDANRFFG